MAKQEAMLQRICAPPIQTAFWMGLRSMLTARERSTFCEHFLEAKPHLTWGVLPVGVDSWQQLGHHAEAAYLTRGRRAEMSSQVGHATEGATEQVSEGSG